MKRSIMLAVAAAVFFGGQFALGADKQVALGGDKPSSEKQLRFNLRLLEGDPLGSPEAGTVKVLTKPLLIACENQPFSFDCGTLVPVTHDGGVQYVKTGQTVKGKPSAVKDGKIDLDVTFSNTTFKGNPEHFQLQTESTRTTTSLRLGEMVKLRCGKGSADKQTWVELSVEEIKP
jgi:hypothetical protein